MTSPRIANRRITGNRRTVACLISVAFAFCLFLSARGYGQALALREYDFKGALLFNIAKYIDWPQNAFSGPTAPIIIGVLGEDPFGDTLDQIVKGRFINGHPITIRRAHDAAELKGAHLVFISPSESHRAAADCAALEAFHILTVGDTEITASHAAVNFAIEGDKAVFTVDLSRTSRVGVISSKLLHLAKVVEGTGVAVSR